jgi:hypothetical protein
MLPVNVNRSCIYVRNPKAESLLARTLENGKNDNPVDMHHGFRSFSLDIITTYCFAQEAGAVETPHFQHPFVLDIESSFPQVLFWRHFPWLLNTLILCGKVSSWLDRAFQRKSTGEKIINTDIMDSLVQQIDRLVENPDSLVREEHETIYHHLLTPHTSKGKFGDVPSKKSLVEEAGNLLAAGGDTVGCTLTAATRYTLQNPGILRKLVKELDNAWTDDAMMGLQELERLPYLVSLPTEVLK